MAQESFVSVFDSIQETPEKEANRGASENMAPLLGGSGESFMKQKEAPHPRQDPVIESQQFNVHQNPENSKDSPMPQATAADPPAQPSAADQALSLTHFPGNLSAFKAHFVKFLCSVPDTIRQSFHGIDDCLSAMKAGSHQ